MKKLLLVVSLFVVLVGCSRNKTVVSYGGNSLNHEQYQAKTKETRNISISFTGHPGSYLRIRTNHIKIPQKFGFESLDICIPNGKTIRIDSLRQGDVKFRLNRIKAVYSGTLTTDEHARNEERRKRVQDDERECTIYIGVDGNENDIQRNYDFGKLFPDWKKVEEKEKPDIQTGKNSRINNPEEYLEGLNRK